MNRETLARRKRAVLGNVVAGSDLLPASVRVKLLNQSGGISIDPTADVRPGFFAQLARVRIGAHSMINAKFFIDGDGEVLIGDHVFIGPHAKFLTTGHDIGPSSQRAGRWVNETISIGDGVWLGADVTVLGGVTIAPGAVVGAGSLVLSDVEPDCLYVGRPARLKKRYED